MTKPETPRIRPGYIPGLIGRVTQMHADYYSVASGFGVTFEAMVARGLAEFCDRPATPASRIWHFSDAGQVLGSITIDGEHLGPDVAHLRWFIVDPVLRGTGCGNALLRKALQHCDDHGFASTRLWTFKGLDVARRLYESHGFKLETEYPDDHWGAEVMEQRFVRSHPNR